MVSGKKGKSGKARRPIVARGRDACIRKVAGGADESDQNAKVVSAGRRFGAVKAAMWQVVEMVSFVVAVFKREGLSVVAGDLAFTTALGLAPAMALGLAAASWLPWGGAEASLAEWAARALAPGDRGKEAAGIAMEFVRRAEGLSWLGTAGLLFTALLTTHALESALSKVWGPFDKGGAIKRLAGHVATIMLAPILIGAGMAATVWMAAWAALAPGEAGEWLGWLAAKGGATALAAGGLAVAYKASAPEGAKWGAALAGGGVAAVVVEMAKAGFGFWLSTVPTYDRIYGAFATIPVFLVWLWVFWMTALAGNAVFAWLVLRTGGSKEVGESGRK